MGTRDGQDAREGAGGANRPDFGRLRGELLEAAAVHEPTERLLEVAAVIASAFADLRVQPVVVGGLALAYWSDSEFVTGDIDMVIPRLPELAERLEALGLERIGREWVLPGHQVSFEAPGETLEPGDEAEAVELASGRKVLVLSPEDLLLWRLREWIHWHGVSGFRQAAHLLIGESLDSQRLDRRAAEEGLARALAELRKMTSELEAGRIYEDWELIEIGKELEQESYSSGDD